MVNQKIRIAFVKFSGMAAGGSEKFIQVIAANLPKDRFAVDFFYCDAAPYIGEAYKVMDTDPARIKYMQEHGVRLIKFRVKAKDITTPFHTWVGTDFWQHFKEENYDIIQTARSGHKEYPFTKIKRTPIVDSLHLSAGVDNKYNISRVMHLCQWSADQWVAKGGDKSRVVIVSHPISIANKAYNNLRQQLGLQNKFVFGFHQRPHDSIFSPLPLAAYKKIETEQTAFVLLGGGESYKQQAKDLGLSNIHFLPPSGELEKVCEFLATLNVYAHGRRDGEVNSQSMAEAMFFGLPIVSHYSAINNGHVECIGQAGLVVENVEQYADELKKLQADKNYYNYRSEQAKKRFLEKYEQDGQIKHFTQIYEDVVLNPFPNKVKRILSSLNYTQNLRVGLIWLYLFFKYRWHMDLLKIFRNT